MGFLIFAGFISFISGIILILFPGVLGNIARWTNKIAVDIDNLTLKYRLGIGISFILTAACLWFIAYYLKVMPILTRLNNVILRDTWIK